MYSEDYPKWPDLDEVKLRGWDGPTRCRVCKWVYFVLLSLMAGAVLSICIFR